MMYVSKSRMGFFPEEMRPAYENSGTWPEDAVAISDEQYQALMEAQVAGKIIDWSGQVPVAVDPPPPSPEQLEAEALAKRDALLAKAALRVAPLQDAVDLGEATEDEEAALTAWKQYRVALNRIQTQEGFPQSIDWPEAPGE